MSYGKPAQGQPPHGQPGQAGQGQAGQGQASHGPSPTRQDMPWPPRPQARPHAQQYAPPQHQAPPGKGRRSRRQAAPPPGNAPDQVPAPERRTSGPVGDEDERWAVPAYVGMFVSGFVAPALVLLVKGRTSDFARFHAVQALNLFIVIFIGTVVSLLLAYFNGVAWLPLVLLVLAADCFVTVWAAIRANRCEWYRLPAVVAPRVFR